MYYCDCDCAGDCMILIIGGEYQKKLEYVLSKYHIQLEDVNDLRKEKLDLNKKCLYHFEEYAFKMVDDNEDVLEEINKIKDELEDKIIIITDIFSGVVPVEKSLRLKREEAAKLACFLSNNSKEVIRVYLGLEQRLK